MKNPWSVRLLIVIALALIVLSCDIYIGGTPATSGGNPVVSIGSPPHGAQIPLGQEVLMQATATDASGVVRIELWVDGVLTTMAQPPSPQSTYTAVLRWTPTTPGIHTLSVKAVNTSSGTSDPAAVSVNVVSSSAPTSVATVSVLPTNIPIAPPTQTPVTPPTNTPVTPPTNTPVTPPTQPPPPPVACPGPPVIASFTANPDTLEVLPGMSGQSTLSWGAVTNATSAVIDQGIGGVAAPGSQVVNLDKTTTFALTATGCGGTTTKQVTVVVKLKTFTVPSSDLQMTDLYAQGGTVYGVIGNNGPDKVENLSMNFSCSWTRTAYGATFGFNGSIGPQKITLISLDKGQTTPFNTGISVDLSQYWYKITCSIQVPFANLNTNTSNDSVTKTLTK